jgi:dihydroorotase
MTESYDLILRHGTCMLPWGRERVDVGVRGSRIVALGDLHHASAEQDIDCTYLHILPGVVDTQVHFREPGNEHKEDLESGTRAAILGGVTAVFEMPNTKPPTTTVEAFQDKCARAKGRTWCDTAFFIGGTPDAGADWHHLEQLPGCAGIKIFMGSSTGNLLVAEDEAIRAILAKARRRVAVHCEDEARLLERKSIAVEAAHPRAHPIWRDEQSALRATTRLLAIARETGARVHVLHVTTAEEMVFLAGQKDVCTVEVLPQHLTLTDADYERIGSFAQMNPPIRALRHQEALWEAIHTGVVDVIGSDHAPHTQEEKALPYPQSPSGMPGVQTMLPLMLNHVNQGRLSLARVVELLATGPQRLYNIAGKGRISLGYDADFAIVDMEHTRTIRAADMASKCGWTPFDGMEIMGWPLMTILRGQVAMREGQVVGTPRGEMVRFGDVAL